MEFTLKEINRNWLDEDSVKKDAAEHKPGQGTDKNKEEAAAIIKSCWLVWRKAKRGGGAAPISRAAAKTATRRHEQHRKLMNESKEEEKVEDYFPAQVPDPAHSKPEDNLNQLLSQLEKDSNHDKDSIHDDCQ